MRRGGSDTSGNPHAPQPPAPVHTPRWLEKRVGRFRLLGLIGRGACARVFIAEDSQMHRRVALKVVTADTTARSIREAMLAAGETADPDRIRAAVNAAVDSMIRSAAAASRIEHPSVVRIFETGRLRGAGGYIAMELLEAGTLRDRLDRGGPLPVTQACFLAAQAAEALQYAHDLGIVHKDVRPANLLLTDAGRCKVADFGLAWLSDPGCGQLPLEGTLAFIAPEINAGAAPDARSDQYALAATLYALLAGHPPFTGDRAQVIEGHARRAPLDLREIRLDLNTPVWEIIERALAKQPQERFANIRQFGDALRRAV